MRLCKIPRSFCSSDNADIVAGQDLQVHICWEDFIYPTEHLNLTNNHIINIYKTYIYNSKLLETITAYYTSPKICITLFNSKLMCLKWQNE